MRGLAKALLMLSLSTVALPARAELKVDGRWRQTALREDFTVQQWLNGCGPAPQSGSQGGGEIVALRMEGDELAFVGGGRVYRTNQCYDPMPTLLRERHSRDGSGKAWTTRCATPPNDPRKAILNTLVTATTDTRIDLQETGRYEVVLETGRCMADVKRTRSWTLVTDEPPASTATAPPATAPKAEPKPPACEAPGAPARLEVRPSKKLLKTGESFQFRPVVLDAKGCATRTATTWKLASPAKGVTVDPANGNVVVAADAVEGAVEIVATAAGKDAKVVVEITSPGHYDELLARSGLNASGENDSASVTTLGTGSLGAGEGTVEDAAKERRVLFIAAVGVLLVVLAVLGVGLQRRTKRAKALEAEAEARHEARVQEVLERRKQREEEHEAQKRAHEASLAAAAAERPAHSVRKPDAPKEPDKTCPVCGREQPWPIAFCPHDGSKLVAPGTGTVAMPMPAPAIAHQATPKRGKICPTCGDRFEGGAEFCGKDGTQLVLLN